MNGDRDLIPTAVLLERAGITHRQLNHWVRQGWVAPDNPHPGQGHTRTFTADEVDVLLVMASLIRHRMTVHAAARLARQSPAIAGVFAVALGAITRGDYE